MRSVFIVFLAMMTISVHAYENSARTMAWVEVSHPVTGDLRSMGINVRKFSYNYVYGEYLLDLQATPLTNLDAVADILKRHDWSAPPAEKINDTTFRWGAPHTGPCTLGINLCSTQVTNAASLRGLPISLFWIANTPFRDLSSLAGLPIRS